MNTELIIKAVNAVIEFNSQDRELPVAAQIEVGKFDIACRVWWNWDDGEFKSNSHVYAYTDQELQQFIDKLQELSQ